MATVVCFGLFALLMKNFGIDLLYGPFSAWLFSL
jgi:hypothetical protein